jgi:N-acetylneuraminate synthase
MMKKIRIGNRWIGDSEPLYFVADIGANHDGDLDRAYQLIETAKEAGADAAKFQNFQADTIVSKEGFESLGDKLSHQKSWKKSVYEVYKNASLPYEWIPKLKERCDNVGLDYFTSPYDFDSVDQADPYVDIYKIGSGDITWLEIIEYIAHKGKPVMIATGASEMKDVMQAMEVLQSFTNDIVLMQCNTNYNASKSNMRYINLRVLETYRAQFPNVLLGLSDHTLGYETVVGAVALGAVVFEKHFTDDNSREGPDHKFSMTPVRWKKMVQSANELYMALGDGQKRVEENEIESAIVQRRALRYTQNFDLDHLLQPCDIIPLRPFQSNGISPDRINEVIGKRLVKDVRSQSCVRWEDIQKC